MHGMNRNRVYLDWNATAPLRPEARAAMLEAMDVVGNPSSVHAEGRAAKAIVEKARGQVAALVECDPQEVVFTSGATEAAALALADRDQVFAAAIEHDCVWAYVEETCAVDAAIDLFRVDRSGTVELSSRVNNALWHGGDDIACLQAANSETGVLQQPSPELTNPRVVLSDAVQAVGKVADLAQFQPAAYRLVSAHKFGGPKGVGACVVARPLFDLFVTDSVMRGGGQERGARSGTENVIGIAGFGAAAAAAKSDLEAGAWERVAVLRDALEARLKEAAPELIIFGEAAPRLANTSCFAAPGWSAESQVIQMDLAGFAISAGSACSSGKVKASRVLMGMGFDEETAGSAIRVSMGVTTTEAEVMAFADAWEAAYKRWAARRRG